MQLHAQLNIEPTPTPEKQSAFLDASAAKEPTEAPRIATAADIHDALTALNTGRLSLNGHGLTTMPDKSSRPPENQYHKTPPANTEISRRPKVQTGDARKLAGQGHTAPQTTLGFPGAQEDQIARLLAESGIQLEHGAGTDPMVFTLEMPGTEDLLDRMECNKDKKAPPKKKRKKGGIIPKRGRKGSNNSGARRGTGTTKKNPSRKAGSK